MQGYYRNAKAITLLNTILLQNMEAALSPESQQVPQILDEQFQTVGNLLDLRDETLIFDMHMGRRMIVVPHANNHAKKELRKK